MDDDDFDFEVQSLVQLTRTAEAAERILGWVRIFAWLAIAAIVLAALALLASA